MDYIEQRRLKIWGRATILPKDAYPLMGNQIPHRTQVERIIHFKIEALDENCRQHIQKRYTKDEYTRKLQIAEQEIKTLKEKIVQLEKS